MSSQKERLIPTEDRVVVECSIEEKSPGGLVIAGGSPEKPHRGVVVAVGPGLPSKDGGEVKPVSLKVGDEVLFGKYIGHSFKMGGKDLVVLRAVDVDGVIVKVKE